jgi:hypothetical protein
VLQEIGEEKTIFDHDFYTDFYTDLAKFKTDRTKSLYHWKKYGIKEGRRCHPGPKVMKIVLMTKNEFPMIKSWIVFHGSIYGFENLYIIDGSDDSRAIEYLDSVSIKLGVHVQHSQSSLNEIASEFNQIFKKLVDKCDFLIKMDTDEFLALYNPESHSISVEKAEIIDYLSNNITYDGSMYKASYTTFSRLSEETCQSSNPVDEDMVALSSYFTPVETYASKSFFASWSFKGVDLGSHSGEVVKHFKSSSSSDKFIFSRLIIVHYHFSCYERFVLTNEIAVLSHKYTDKNASATDQMIQLLPLVEDYPMGCKILSCHKVYEYVLHLLAPEMHKAYYTNKHFRNEHSVKFPEMKLLINSLNIKYGQHNTAD